MALRYIQKVQSYKVMSTWKTPRGGLVAATAAPSNLEPGAGSAPSLPCARRSWCHAPVQAVRRSLSCVAWVHRELWVKIFKQKDWTNLMHTQLKQALLKRKRNANTTTVLTKRMKFDTYNLYETQIAYTWVLFSLHRGEVPSALQRGWHESWDTADLPPRGATHRVKPAPRCKDVLENCQDVLLYHTLSLANR